MKVFSEKIKDIIHLCRPYQYPKNLLILSPLFFGFKITDAILFTRTLLAFVSFSLIASSVYIFNDYYDVEEDRKHPQKKNRPLASGRVSKNTAIILTLILLLPGSTISALINTRILYLIIFYVALNIAYTLKLKHVAIIDVFTIATGFIIRIFIGSAVTGIELSMWIIIITFVLALFLAIGKRRDDILIYLSSGEKTRKVIDGYNLEALNSFMIIMASVTIVLYILYTVSPEIMGRTHSDKLYFTVVFVLLGIMRYLQIIFVEKNSGSPTEIVLKDRFIQLSIFGWILTFVILIY